MLGMLFLSLQLLAQNRTITGKVTDDKGQPVPNASVVVKGTNIGTTTNAQGVYSLAIPQNARTLSVSSIGLGEKEITISSATAYDVTLNTQSKNDMSEVVVVAYGQQKRATITGSIATIKGGELENRPFSSVDKALQGAVPGLFSAATSGAPGSNQTIRIRGISSINAGNNPLWVIDGQIINTGDASRLTTTANLLSTLNPNDIESISVLKDAAALSIYGSQGANGVILVTTKKGKSGKTKFRADAEVGYSDIAYFNDKYKPLNAKEFFDLTREGLLNLGVANPDPTLQSFGFGNGQDYNWLEGVTRRGTQRQYNLSASGGSDRSTYFVSGGYFNQEGTTIRTNLERYNTNIGLTAKATDKLNFQVNLNGGFTRQRTPLAGGAFGNPVLSSFFLLPSRNPFKADGTYNITAPDFGTGALHNTIYTSDVDKRLLKQASIRGNFMGSYAILDNLKFTTNLGGDFNTVEEDQYNNPFHGDGFNTAGRAFNYYTRYFRWTATNYFDYHQKLNSADDINFDFKVGYEANKSKANFVSTQTQGFPPTLLLNQVSVGATPITAAGSFSDVTYASAFSNITANFKNRYVLYGSFRRDGSSRFGPKTKYGNFWSIGGSWNVNNEKFFEGITFVDQLKLRSSYGLLGNNQIGNYDWIPSYGYGANYNQLPGSIPNAVGDSSLSWENNRNFNIGLDLTVLKNRLSFTVDFFERKGEDLLLRVALPPTTGYDFAIRNRGKMVNRGVELSLNATPVRTKNFTWNIDGNFTKVQNRVTDIPAPFANGAFQITKGYDLQTYFVRLYAGVDPANGDPLWYTDETKTTTTNNVNAAQRVMFGQAGPKVYGGFGTNFNYKGITLSTQFSYAAGHYVRDTWGSFYVSSGANGTFNKVRRQLDRWQKPGDITDIPKYVYNGNKNANAFSTFYLYKGDYIRLREVQLAYQLPTSLISKVKMSSVNVYVRGTNLWTWVKDKNMPFDPENGIGSATNLEVFIPKTFTAGVNIGF